MTSTTRPSRGGRLPAPAAFYLQTSIVLFLLASSSAPTPIYSIYQAEWGFTPIVTTVVFGTYAVAVLVSLLTIGSLSDHVGRRPVLLTALSVQAITMLVFASATGVTELLLARGIQGLATGAALGAVGAALLDLDKDKGTIANSIGAMVGTATGSIASGLLVQFLPAPTQLVYLVLFVVFVGQVIGVALMAETAAPKPGALGSLRIQVGLPAGVRRPILLAIPALIAVWSLTGFYGSLGPSLVREITGSSSHLLGGLALFVLAASGGGAILLIRAARPRTAILIGTVSLLAGIGTTMVAITTGSAVGFFAGTAVAGVGFGAGFQGSMRSVIPLAAPHERSAALSIIYVVSYLAMGLPAVLGGVLVVYGSGLRITAVEYGAVVMLLAGTALAGSLLTARAERRTVARRAESASLAPPLSRADAAQLCLAAEHDAMTASQSS